MNNNKYVNIITLFLILAVTFSCKNEKKKEIEVAPKVFEKHYKTIKSFTNADLATWTKTKVSIEPVTDVEFGGAAYLLSRNTITDPAYFSSGLIPVTYASEYRLSIVVKKGTKTNFFGLRITGAFPDRVDGLFDLDKGIVVDYKTSQDFESPMATIENLSDGWYKCKLSAGVAADNVQIIMGATSIEKPVGSWEGKTEHNEDVYFVPSSILFEEVFIN
jgi:hypothetical protein